MSWCLRYKTFFSSSLTVAQNKLEPFSAESNICQYMALSNIQFASKYLPRQTLYLIYRGIRLLGLDEEKHSSLFVLDVNDEDKKI